MRDKSNEINRKGDKTPPYQPEEDITHHSDIVRHSEQFASPKKPTFLDYYSPEWVQVKRQNRTAGQGRRWDEAASMRKAALDKFYKTPLGQTLGEIALKAENAWKRLSSTPTKQAWDKTLKQQSDAKRAATETGAYRELSELEFSLNQRRKYVERGVREVAVHNAREKAYQTAEWHEWENANQAVEEAENAYKNTPEYERYQYLSKLETKAKNVWENLQESVSVARVLHQQAQMEKAQKEVSKTQNETNEATSKARPDFIKGLIYQFHKTRNQNEREINAAKMLQRSSDKQEASQQPFNEWNTAVNDWAEITENTAGSIVTPSRENLRKSEVSQRFEDAKKNWEQIQQEFRMVQQENTQDTISQHL